MKILIVCHRLPFPPDHGGKIRAFEMIKHLGAQHSVTVATLAHTQKELQVGNRLLDYCDQLMVEVLPSSVRWAKATLALAGSKPSSGRYFWSARLQRAIAGAGSFDRVLVHCAFMAEYVRDTPSPFKVLDYADIDSGKWSDYQSFKRQPLGLAYKLEARKLRRHERQVAAYFNACAVTTKGEQQEFYALGTSQPCVVIPNGVDFDYFNPAGRAESSAPVILFLGRMNYFPNVDGIVEFATNVFPRVRAAVPQARLRIVGSDPTRSVRRLIRMPGIEVTGYVPDVRPYMADASIGIAPLRIARGTQNKVLEMMAAGIPVVASSQAAKGIQAIDGEHLLVAGSLEGFTNHVITLLRDRNLRRKLSAAGRNQVEKEHSWPAAMELLDEVLQLREAVPSPSPAAVTSNTFSGPRH
ncbi:MAG TPA: TIGR03087 family PEP-CTERM/XrtA system glycosyltransferase [Terriglobales bacterium]|nr:TIGR03087 family PEP-CTERM/XrtA system glycosyltransferase [Terriglobales bacterium]